MNYRCPVVLLYSTGTRTDFHGGLKNCRDVSPRRHTPQYSIRHFAFERVDTLIALFDFVFDVLTDSAK